MRARDVGDVGELVEGETAGVGAAADVPGERGVDADGDGVYVFAAWYRVPPALPV